MKAGRQVIPFNDNKYTSINNTIKSTLSNNSDMPMFSDQYGIPVEGD